ATAEVAHAQIERALRLVTVRRGHDLRACTLVAYGGAGPMHAGAVALSAGVERVLVPALPSTLSALGCCLSELAIDDVRTWLAPRGDVELGETVFGPVLLRGAVELVEGPAVLADALSTVVVWPGQTAHTDEDGNVWLERA